MAFCPTHRTSTLEGAPVGDVATPSTDTTLSRLSPVRHPNVVGAEPKNSRDRRRKTDQEVDNPRQHRGEVRIPLPREAGHLPEGGKGRADVRLRYGILVTVTRTALCSASKTLKETPCVERPVRRRVSRSALAASV